MIMRLVRNPSDSELLQATFAECVDGTGRLVLVSGGLATGKTTLLHTFLSYAAGHGAAVLTATGARTERTLRMGVVSQLFQGTDLPPEVSRVLDVEPPDDDT